MDALCDDLSAELDDLDGLVADADLATPTPAEGWTVGDQISHLWYYDQRAALALTDPEAFAADTARWMAALAAGDSSDPSIEAGRAVSASELLANWRADRRRLIDVARLVDPKARVPWYGPPMGARSFVTARLMETWAHGQDVADGLGAERVPTGRLRHVAHIGVGARAYSYIVNGKKPPDVPVFVGLDGPDGDRWEWGSSDGADRVEGDALEFCLVVTQRRHLADTSLDVAGPAAIEWMSFAQAYAGPAGGGREPAGLIRPTR